MNADLRAVGEAVREQLKTEPGRSSHVALRARLVEVATQKAPPRCRWKGVAIAVMPLAATALLLLVLASRPQALTFSVDGMPAGEAVHRVYRSGATETRALGFSDGSRIHIAASGAVRVTDTMPNGATVEVVDGSARVAIVPRQGASWRFVAGPYTVRVTGTSFDIEWDDSEGRFSVTMREGAVNLHGPKLTEGKVLRGQQRFEAVVPGWKDPEKQTPARQVAPAPPEPGATMPRDSDKTLAPAQTSMERAETVKPAAQGLGQSQSLVAGAEARPATLQTALVGLAQQGQYAQVIEQAERVGISGVLQRGSLKELMAVADSARYLRRFDLARRALLQVRSRFPGSSHAAGAAFVLGRMDEIHDASAALGWYETYLMEAAAGPLAPEALGRKLLVIHRLRGRQAAAQAAREYLTRFPTGAHARHAREILGEPETSEE